MGMVWVWFGHGQVGGGWVGGWVGRGVFCRGEGGLGPTSVDDDELGGCMLQQRLPSTCRWSSLWYQWY